MLRKERNKERQVGVERAAPAPQPKRRKINSSEYIETGKEKAGQPRITTQEKRQGQIENNEKVAKKKQKRDRDDIRSYFNTTREKTNKMQKWKDCKDEKIHQCS